MINFECRPGVTIVSLVLAIFLFGGCTGGGGSDTDDLIIGGLWGSGPSSDRDDEPEYNCRFSDYGAAAGFGTVQLVSPSTDITGKYSSFSSLGLTKRHGIAIIEPQSPPAYEDREYIVFLSAGHQGPWILSTDSLFTGYPSNLTGQRKDWSYTWSPYFANSEPQSVCKASIRNRLIADSIENGRLPQNRTYMTGAFDSRFSWADKKAGDTADAWLNHIKSLGNPAKIKGIYLAGSSMGGCLANWLGSKLNRDAVWGNVPIIVQGGDPVCPNSANSTAPSFMSVGGTKIDNPSADDSDYFTYQTNGYGYYNDLFVKKERIKVYNILGGGKVTFVNKSRSFSHVSFEYGSGALTHTTGDFAGGFESNQWFRQYWIHACHACLGRNWHHWLMSSGSDTEHDMMRFYRDSYNDLNFWGAWVNFWTGDFSAGTYSGGIKHETPLLQKKEVIVFADKDQAKFLQRDIFVPIDVMGISTATYGVDFDFLDEDGNPVVVHPYGAYVTGGATPKDVFAIANASGPPTLYVRKPRTQAAQTQGRFYIRVLNDDDVETDETVYLRINDYPILGRPRQDARQYKLTIRDHDTVPWTQTTCEEAGGVWTPGGVPPCAFTGTVMHDPSTNPDTSGTGGGSCDENGGTWDPVGKQCLFRNSPIKDSTTCGSASGNWNTLSIRCEKRPPPGAQPYTLDTCRTAAGHWYGNEQVCIHLGAIIPGSVCGTLGFGAVWDSAAQVCRTNNLKFTSNWCGALGGTWDGSNCKLTSGRPNPN